MPATKPPARRASAAPDRAGAADAPEIIVDFRFERGLLHVAVANVGDAPAHRVTVRFDKPFRGLGGACEISGLALFRRLAFLAPHKSIETFVDASSAYFRRREPTRLTADIAYLDSRGRKHARRIVHDLSIYRDLTYLVGPSAASPSSGADATPASPSPRTGAPDHGRAAR